MCFDKAIKVVLAHEGGFINHPDDPGGPTKWGISQRFLQDIGLPHEISDIKDMSQQQAIDLYRIHWWEKYHYHQLPEPIAIKLFDLAVNIGSRQAHRLIQRACRACHAPIKEDGILGPITKKTIETLEPNHLLAALRAEAAGFYRTLTAITPLQRKQFLNGWLKRAYFSFVLWVIGLPYLIETM